MDKMIVINKRRFILFIAFLLGLFTIVGIVFGRAIAIGPKTEADSINSANKIVEFIESKIDKNIEVEKIEKEAKKMGRKQGLLVSFIEKNDYIKVNISKDLGDRYPLIKSFKVNKEEK